MNNSLFRDKPWLSSEDLPGTPVGMLCKQEAAMFYWMARGAFSGRGTIIDAGSFIGKSAFSFARGLQDNPRFKMGRDKIHCFDLFQAVHYTTVDFFRERLGIEIRLGDSTRDIFEAQVSQVRDLLDVHEGDLHTMTWEARPIEILMVDIAKSESLGSRVVEMFFQHLVPGASYVIHQDYHHAWHPHIHVVMSYLADYFDIMVPRADTSAVFFLKCPIPSDVLQRAARYDFSHEEKLQLIDAAIARLPAPDRPTVRLARLIASTEQTSAASALADLAEQEKAHADLQTDDLWSREARGVRCHLLEKDGWQQHRNHRHELVMQRADELIALGRRGWSVLSLRGSALRALGRLDEAEKDLTACLAANPHNCFSITEMAKLLVERGRFEEAAAELERGLRGPSVTSLEYRWYFEALGMAFFKSAQANWCSSVMENLRATFEGQPEYWVLHARILSYLGMRAQASTALDRAVVCALPDSRRLEVAQMLHIDLPQP